MKVTTFKFNDVEYEILLLDREIKLQVVVGPPELEYSIALGPIVGQAIKALCLQFLSLKNAIIVINEPDSNHGARIIKFKNPLEAAAGRNESYRILLWQKDQGTEIELWKIAEGGWPLIKINASHSFIFSALVEAYDEDKKKIYDLEKEVTGLRVVAQEKCKLALGRCLHCTEPEPNCFGCQKLANFYKGEDK
jgi:hypothetical protein